MKKVVKIIALIIFFIGIGVGSYFLTEYLDKNFKNKGKAVIEMVYDDTDTYVIPNVLKESEEEALETWPYIFTIKNKGNCKGLYQIIIDDIPSSTIERDKLLYILNYEDEKLASGKLSDLKNNVLYTNEILKKKEQRYELYIWTESEETTKEDIYEYKLTLNAINDGGPGF